MRTHPLAVLLTLAGWLLATGCSSTSSERTRFDAAAIDSVHVDASHGSVTIDGSNTEAVEVTAIVTEGNRRATRSSMAASGRLVLSDSCEAGWGKCSVSYRIVVPDHVDVRVRTGNGRIAVRGIAGRVDLAAGNGAIVGRELESTTARAHTDNGAVSMAFDRSPDSIEVATGNGAIDIAVPAWLAYAVDAESRRGGVEAEIVTDEHAPRTITARSGNGQIIIRTPVGADER